MRKMDTILFCTSFIPSSRHPTAVDGIERWRKWIDYYSKRMELFGADRLIVIDDGSPIENLQLPVAVVSADGILPSDLPAGVVLFRFDEHLGRSSMYRFPGWWRSFSFAAELSRAYGFRKFIHIESDAYVISQRLVHYIRNCDQGWTSFVQAHFRTRLARLLYPRDPQLGFWASARMKSAYLLNPAPLAEPALQVICEDCFTLLERIWRLGPEYWRSELAAERDLPFSHLERRFIGDRYGEMGLSDYPTDVDFVSQSRVEWAFENRLTPDPTAPSGIYKAL